MEFLSYAAQLFTPENLLWLTIGATVGVVLGALPGMSADTGIGIFLPLTFALPPVTALICLGAIYVCASYGGKYGDDEIDHLLDGFFLHSSNLTFNI